MTPAETLTLAAYFFVLIILAIYGWHRYYLVYLYMSNRDKEPQARSAARSAAGRHDPAAALQRDVRRRSPDRRGLPRSTTRASCSRSRCSTTRPTRRAASPSWRCAASPPQGIDIKYIHRADRTGYKAGALEAGLKVARGEFVAHLRRRLHPDRRLPDPADAALPRPEGRHGAGALGPHQPGLLAADEDPGDPARRPLRPRARRPQPRRPLLQLQRHGRHLAPHRRSTTPAAGSTTR